MQRDVSRLRNISVLASGDAGDATYRERFFELIGGGRTSEGAAPVGGPLIGRDASPARSGTWTPRSGPFVEEPTTVTVVEHAPRAIDGAVVVLDGGRAATTETGKAALRDASSRRVPCVVFIDDVGGLEDLETMVDELELDLGMSTVPVYVPWSDERGTHIIDVLEQRLVLESDDGAERSLRPLPMQAREIVGRVRRRIVDVCAEVDDSIHGASAAGLDVGADELARALRKATIARDAQGARVLVVTCGSSRAGRGVGLLLDAVVSYLPSPAERPPVFGVDPRRSVRVARFAREDDALSATVIASTDVPDVGQLTWLRIHSGTLDVSANLALSPDDARGAVERLFLPDVRGLRETDTAGPGAVVGVTGLSGARAGGTVSCVRAPVVLDEAQAPRGPEAHGTTYVAPHHTGTIWSVARGLQSVPISSTGLRRTRG